MPFQETDCYPADIVSMAPLDILTNPLVVMCDADFSCLENRARKFFTGSVVNSFEERCLTSLVNILATPVSLHATG